MLIARIDVMIPLDGSGAPCPDRLFTQLEIEARAGGADPGAIEADPDLWAALAPLLTSATRTKVDLAGGAGPGPVWSAAETAARVAAVAAATADLAGRSPWPELTALHDAVPRRSPLPRR